MKWQLMNKQFLSFRDCECGEYVQCPNHITTQRDPTDHIKWSLICFPNGHDKDHRGFITFQLYTTYKFPSNASLNIELCIKSNQIPLNSSFTLQFHQKKLYQYMPTQIHIDYLDTISYITFDWNILNIEDDNYKNTESKENHKSSVDISPLSSPQSIDAKVIWQIKESALSLIIHKPGFNVWSDTFRDRNVSDHTQFQLEIRNNNKYTFSISVLLHLLSLKQHVKIVTVCASIICIETKTRNYGVFDMTLYDNAQCTTKAINLLRPNSLEKYELQNIKTLTCICELEILKMVSFDDNVIYLKQSNVEDDNSVKHYEWKVTQNQVHKFKHAINGKVFCGPKYDIWYLKASPNGISPENKGRVQLDVCNLYIPSGYYKIIGYVNIQCRELNLSVNDTVEFTGRNRSYSWPIDTLETKRLQSLNSITFEFDMQIIKRITRNEHNKGYLRSHGMIGVSGTGDDEGNKCNGNAIEIKELRETVHDLQQTVKELQTQFNQLMMVNINHLSKPCNISQWLKSLNLEEYTVIFDKHGYDDFVSMSELTHYDLDQIGIHKKGHRMKLLQNISKQLNISIKKKR